MSKSKLRARLRSLSFPEKVKILEKLRDRDRAIAASGLRATRANNAEKETSLPVRRGAENNADQSSK